MDDPKFPKKSHHVVKWILGIAGIILILLLATAWYINKRWKPLLAEAIKSTVIEATDSLYSVDFSDIKINILSGGVTIDHIQINPNLHVYQKLIHQGLAAENIAQLSINSLSLKNVNPIKVYRYRKLDIADVNIDQPSLILFYTKLKNQKNKIALNKTPYDRIKKVLKEIKIGTLFLADVKLKYVEKSNDKRKVTELDKVNIRLNDILINDTSALDKKRLFSTKDIIAEISDYDFATPDSMYHLNIKHLTISSQKKQLVVSGIGLIPRYGDMAFSEQFDFQQERYKVLFDTLVANNINLNQLIDHRIIATSSVKLMNGELAVFLNRDKPYKAIDKSQNFPHVALQRVAWGIAADTVTVKNLDINYTEYNPKTKSEGTTFFNELNGQIFNVTNVDDVLNKNHFANAYATTYLMGKGKLNVHIQFDLTDSKGAFSYDGSLGEMPTSAFNRLTKPLAMVTTSSGKINSMTFNAKGNSDGAKGSVILKYEDLNVVLMKKDERANFKRLGLISYFANALLLEHSNPLENGKLRVANVYYKRPLYGSFFNLMWKVVFAGVKESVGITPEKEARLKIKARNYQEARQRREHRKLERQERRAARNNK
ncbi:hypothetical protein N9R54_04185 [Pelobium sp.]|nr:hypothetical protein [Pelobium sp.]MDA9555412.1 hypothetical protein [Pelobium sp.]